MRKHKITFRKKSNLGFARYLTLIIAFLSLLILVFDLGFNHSPEEKEIIDISFLAAIATGVFSVIFRYFFKSLRPRLKAIPFDFLFLAFLSLVFLVHSELISADFFPAGYLSREIWIYISVLLIFIREFSEVEINFSSKKISPAQIFILSFFVIIIIGSLMLLLPKATNGNLSYIDSLFTSTSAVCVTGLIVVDTGTFFTQFGQMIILGLIQIGGLGIMTFASYFSYFFKGKSSFNSQLALQDMTSSDRIGEVFVVLKRILFLTFLIEAIGAVLIYYSIDETIISGVGDRIFFSVFHAISGFCNGGFSTLSNGLFEPLIKFNYPLQLIIASLIILGGLGFPIIFNLFRYLTNYFRNRVRRWITRKPVIHFPWIININTRIVVITTLILIFGGMAFFFGLEYNTTLSEHGLWGKFVNAFFTSVTTRTAGFNTIDFSQMTVPATLLVIFLMWVGASPASTGGGIKTSTLAIAVLNFFSLAKHKTRIEIFRREIAESSVNRAFAIIFLSIIVIGCSVFLLSITDPDKGLLNLVFESVSAFATVGLSRGITAGLSEGGKIILIVTMFIGRVNMLTILIALFNKFSHANYRYPTETILIN